MSEMSGSLVEIGSRLRDERDRLRRNQADFGRLGGVNRSSQAEYEGGKRPFSANYLVALAEAGVDVGFVMTGARSSSPQASDPTLITLRVALPPRSALAQMFEGVLQVYPDLHGAELAQALARHLPSGLAQLTDLEAVEDRPTAPASAAPSDRPEGPQRQRQARRR